jgi:hypothetical protein
MTYIVASMIWWLGRITRLSFAPDGVVCSFDVSIIEVAAEEVAFPNVASSMEDLLT